MPNYLIGNVRGPEGPQGPAGKDGVDGKDGADGVSVTHSWNGTVLTVNSASGKSSADLQGPAADLSGYYNKKEVDAAIQKAIGDVLGGAS